MGRLHLETVAIDLTHTVEESLDLLAPQATEKKLELASIIAHELPPLVLGDPIRLRQILLNLLSNALKFTERGSVVITVHPCAQDNPTTKNQIRFEVKDTGIGIDPATQAKLFQPFTQADTSTTRRYGGTGLGLAISRQIVALMGGTMGVESAAGQGSTFWFTIPMPPPGDSPPAKNTPIPSIREGLRLLLLDTSETVTKTLAHHARRWKYTLIQAQGSADAIRLADASHAEGKPYDALVFQQTQDNNGLLPHIKTGGTPLPVVLIGQAQSLHPGQNETTTHLQSPIRSEHLIRVLLVLSGSSQSFTKPAPIPPKAVNATPFAPSSLQILVAEDNVVNQRVVQLQLRKIGCTARIVSNGLEALKETATTTYDVILMDCQMPELDGYETTRRLRLQEWTKNIYIIAMTANALEGDRKRCLDAGMDDYLAKPAREQDLVAALSRAPVAKRNGDTNDSSPQSKGKI